MSGFQATRRSGTPGTPQVYAERVMNGEDSGALELIEASLEREGADRPG
jgi:hypothetical protein